MKHSSLIIFVTAALFIFGAQQALAASMYVTPSGGTYHIGDTISATVHISSPSQAMNAASATVTFSADVLTLQGASHGNSILKYWTTEPSGSSASGRVVFGGGLPTPGYKGSGGTLMVMTFKAKAAGTATIAITGGSVLANDGLGTNSYTGQSGASYKIEVASNTNTTTPTTPSVPTRPTPVVGSTNFANSQSWYRDTAATITWTHPATMQGVSYTLSKDRDTVPDDTLDPDTGTTSVPLPADGQWYFHLKAKYDSGWSATTHFLLQRDANPPDQFDVTIERDRGATDPTPVAIFAPHDATSGIDHITLAIDGGTPAAVSSPYTLALTKAGSHTVLVTAYDKAGNSQTGQATFTVEGYSVPVITSVTSPIILLDTVTVRGTANAGDMITVYVNGEVLGQVTAGVVSKSEDQNQVAVRVPWVFTSDRVYRPGSYQVTATATSPDGQISVPTDPRTLKIIGGSIMIGGRALATMAVAPIAITIILFLVAVVVLVMVRSIIAVRRMHTHELDIDEEIEDLRIRILRGRMTSAQVESNLERIEEDIQRKPGRSARRRKS